MSIDSINIFRLQTGTGNRKFNASLHGCKIGRHKMAGIRRHCRTGHFNLCFKSVGTRKFICCQNDTTGPFGHHKPLRLAEKGRLVFSGDLRVVLLSDDKRRSW